MPQQPTPRPTLMRVFDDPTPNGVINQRILQHTMKLLEHTTLTQEEKQKVFNLTLLIAKKLATVWKHKEEYTKTQKSLVEAEEVKDEDPAIRRLEVSQDLFMEFDEFLVQLKSTLDYLVHLPVPIFGRKKWNLRSFGDKGNDVVNAMRRNLPREQQKMVEGIVKILFEQRKDWLTWSIHARDKVNHFLDGGVPFEYFAVTKVGYPPQIRVPMWSNEQTIESFMEISWHNLFTFVEDFIATFLYFRFEKGKTLFHGSSEFPSPISPWVLRSQDDMELATKGPGWNML